MGGRAEPVGGWAGVGRYVRANNQRNDGSRAFFGPLDTSREDKGSALTCTLLATGELKFSRPPRGRAVKAVPLVLLDHKREFQETGELTNFVTTGAKTREVSSARAGFGGLAKPTRFGKVAKQVIREAGAVMDRSYGRNVLFLTWTLPGHSQEIFDVATRFSAQFVQDVLQWLRDTVANCVYAWVYEFQKRGALHQHIVLASEDDAGLESVLQMFGLRMRKFFVKWSRQANCNLFYSEKTQRLNIRASLYGQKAERATKSAARYLTKYLSKHRSKDGLDNSHCPSRWWRVSKKCNALIRSQRDRLRIVGNGDELDRILGLIANQGRALGAQLKFYENARFPWLLNLRAWSENVETGQFRWAILKQTAIGALGAGCRVCQKPLVKACEAVAVLPAVAKSVDVRSVAEFFGAVKHVFEPPQQLPQLTVIVP